VAVRSRGELNTGVTAIQLVFDNGLESPLFDSDNANADDLREYELNKSVIRTATCRVHE
jgi:hypothetical protein